MPWPFLSALIVARTVFVLIGRRGNRSRLSRVDPSSVVDVTLVQKWWTEGDTPDSPLNYWWRVTWSGADKPVKVLVAGSTWEEHDASAGVTLHVNPRTGRLYEETEGRRMRLGFESVGWTLIGMGVVAGVVRLTQ